MQCKQVCFQFAVEDSDLAVLTVVRSSFQHRGMGIENKCSRERDSLGRGQKGEQRVRSGPAGG